MFPCERHGEKELFNEIEMDDTTSEEEGAMKKEERKGRVHTDLFVWLFRLILLFSLLVLLFYFHPSTRKGYGSLSTRQVLMKTELSD